MTGDDKVFLDATQPFRGWEPRINDAATFRLYRVPLDILSPDEIVGVEVDVSVTLRFDDGHIITETLVVTIVDEFEEGS